MSASDRYQCLTLQDRARQTLAQILGGTFFFLTAYFTWRSVTATERNLRLAQDNLRVVQDKQQSDQAVAEANLRLTQQKLLTDRFTSAVTNLGSDKLSVRLGGIYALGQIATENAEQLQEVAADVLTAYARDRAPVSTTPGTDTEPQAASLRGSIEVVSIIAPDVQAVISVLSRWRFEGGEGSWLDLSGINMRGINLIKMNMSGVKFSGSCLADAELTEGDLTESNLQLSNLSGADLTGAELDNADLRGACLLGAVGLTQDQLGTAICDSLTEVDAPLAVADSGR